MRQQLAVLAMRERAPELLCSEIPKPGAVVRVQEKQVVSMNAHALQGRRRPRYQIQILESVNRNDYDGTVGRYAQDTAPQWAEPLFRRGAFQYCAETSVERHPAS